MSIVIGAQDQLRLHVCTACGASWSAWGAGVAKGDHAAWRDRADGHGDGSDDDGPIRVATCDKCPEAREAAHAANGAKMAAIRDRLAAEAIIAGRTRGNDLTRHVIASALRCDELRAAVLATPAVGAELLDIARDRYADWGTGEKTPETLRVLREAVALAPSDVGLTAALARIRAKRPEMWAASE